MGDPGGIGPEVAFKALQAFRRDTKAVYVLAGTKIVFNYLRDCLKIKKDFPELKHFDPKTLARKSGVYFFDPGIDPNYANRFSRKPDFHPGKAEAGNALFGLSALSWATHQAVCKKAQAVVTAPVNKTSFRKILPGFTGHTEFLAEKSRTKKFAMMFVSPKLKVTLATIHLALGKVPAALSAKLILEKIELTHQFLKKRLCLRRPRIGICALNPHGRETGTEEARIIEPAVQQAKRKGIPAFGPFSADQLFYEAHAGRYDALISMYHDQALGPFKMIAFHDGVNVTLGLPFIRTSPDHGTAYDIAYRGKADERSMRAAVQLARDLLIRKR